MMILELLPHRLTVCQVKTLAGRCPDEGLWFAASTGDELSLVCETRLVPADAVRREDGWRGLRVRGPLDFSLVGILAKIAGTLADAGISLFAVSTFDTDYILVKQARLSDALQALQCTGYDIKE